MGSTSSNGSVVNRQRWVLTLGGAFPKGLSIFEIEILRGQELWHTLSQNHICCAGAHYHELCDGDIGNCFVVQQELFGNHYVVARWVVIVSFASLDNCNSVFWIWYL